MATNDNNNRNFIYGVVLSISALIILILAIISINSAVELFYILLPISITIFMYSYAFIYTYVNINKLQDNETYKKNKALIMNKKSMIIALTAKIQLLLFILIWISFVIFLTYVILEFQSYQGLIIIIPFCALLIYLIKIVYPYLINKK